MVEFLQDVGSFAFTREQRDRFVTGSLWRDWSCRYPELFDADDVRLASSQAHLGYHFCEWLSAIILYETTGYLSLVEKYEFARHKRKRAIVEQLLESRVSSLLARGPRAQCPDLLVFSPDLSDWWFCEVKGPKDHIRPPQAAFFRKLAAASGRAVGLLSLSEISERRHRRGF